MSDPANYEHWKAEEFYRLQRAFDERSYDCHALVLMPTEKVHESGYRCIDYVIIANRQAMFLVTTKADVFACSSSRRDWKLDCLPGSGLLRLYVSGGLRVTARSGYSDINIEPIRKD